LGRAYNDFLGLVIVFRLASFLQVASRLCLLPQHPIDPFNSDCGTKLVRRAPVAAEDTHWKFFHVVIWSRCP